MSVQYAVFSVQCVVSSVKSRGRRQGRLPQTTPVSSYAKSLQTLTFPGKGNCWATHIGRSNWTIVHKIFNHGLATDVNKTKVISAYLLDFS